MTSIQLTEQHKSKLLEMCKSLFPEIKHWFFDEQMLDIGSYIAGVNENRVSNHLFLSKMEKAPFDDGIFIHWFEFCTIFIMEKLSRDGGGKEFSDYISICFRYTFPSWDLIHPIIHPVDYLYDKFKELQ